MFRWWWSGRTELRRLKALTCESQSRPVANRTWPHLHSFWSSSYSGSVRQPCLWIHQPCLGRDAFPNELAPVWSWSWSDGLRLIKRQTAALLLHQLWLPGDSLKTPTVPNVCVFLLCMVCVCARRCWVGMSLLCTSRKETGMEGGGGVKAKETKKRMDLFSVGSTVRWKTSEQLTCCGENRKK